MATAHWGSYSLKNRLKEDPVLAAFGEAALDPAITNTTIQQYGEARLLQAFNDAIDAHNEAINDLMDPLVVFTDDRIRPYGERIGVTRVRAIRVDQHGSADAQRERMPEMETSNIGFPLERYQFAWNFTRDYIETASPADAAKRLAGVQLGDLDEIEYSLRTAFFNPSSVLDYRDHLIDQLQIPIRRLANGDGQMLPLGPNNEVFDPNAHTHYVGRVGASVAASDISALFDNVREHGVVGPMELWINMEDEPTIRAMPNFYEFQAVEVVTPVLTPGTEVMRDRGPLIETVDPDDPENMYIGRWNAKYNISTKPWIYPGYFLVLDRGRRPLAWRTRANPTNAFGAQGRAALRIVGESENFPLRAEWMEREFGIGVQDRLSAAILYGGATSYVAPTIVRPAVA